jgi:hypothetical protein
MPRRVEIDDDEDEKPPRHVEIEDDEEETTEETLRDNSIPILWRKELQLWTIGETNVVFSPEICMVIGFVYRSVLIRASSKEVKQVCDTYKVIYLDPEKYFI